MNISSKTFFAVFTVILLIVSSTNVCSQTTIVDVKVLSDKGDFGWEGLVNDNEVRNNPELKALLGKLRTAQEKSVLTESAQGAKSSLESSNKALADLEKARKTGLISESDYQRAREEMQKAIVQLKEKQQMASAVSSVANPAKLKEQIRKFCLGQQFYRRIYQEVDGVRLVEVGADKAGHPYTSCGFINEQGNVIVEPRYLDFNNGMQHLQGRFSFNKLDLIVAFSGYTTETHRACVVDRKGRVAIPPEYYWLEFFNDCPLLRARKTSSGKWGIIDLYGRLLEPYVHNGKYAESLTDAKNRIMKEYGWTPSRLF